MSKTAKELIKSFYNINFLEDTHSIKEHLHPDIELIWNSTEGLNILHFNDILLLFSEIKRTYTDLRIEVSHLLEDDLFVTIRYKYYVRTMENPDEELGIAHFIAIWEVKDGKIYRGHQISQPVMDQDDTNKSYHKVKV